MSDFDREAEREQLREQFERDEAKREATERMSELLLKGATMTNRHCDTCGDPIFRHDGRAFCPTCHGGPEGVPGPGEQPTGESRGDDPDAVDATAETPAQPDGVAEQRPDETGRPAGQHPDEPGRPAGEHHPAGGESSRASAPESADPGPTAREGAEMGHADETRPVPEQDARGAAGPEPSPAANPRRRTGDAGDVAGDAPGGDDLAAARASLTRSLAALARRAESAEDVSRAREFLAAAREAAEALEAAERVGG